MHFGREKHTPITYSCHGMTMSSTAASGLLACGVVVATALRGALAARSLVPSSSSSPSPSSSSPALASVAPSRGRRFLAQRKGQRRAITKHIALLLILLMSLFDRMRFELDAIDDDRVVNLFDCRSRLFVGLRFDDEAKLESSASAQTLKERTAKSSCATFRIDATGVFIVFCNSRKTHFLSRRF